MKKYWWLVLKIKHKKIVIRNNNWIESYYNFQSQCGYNFLNSLSQATYEYFKQPQCLKLWYLIDVYQIFGNIEKQTDKTSLPSALRFYRIHIRPNSNTAERKILKTCEGMIFPKSCSFGSSIFWAFMSKGNI